MSTLRSLMSIPHCTSGITSLAPATIREWSSRGLLQLARPVSIHLWSALEAATASSSRCTSTMDPLSQMASSRECESWFPMTPEPASPGLNLQAASPAVLPQLCRYSTRRVVASVLPEEPNPSKHFSISSSKLRTPRQQIEIDAGGRWLRRCLRSDHQRRRAAPTRPGTKDRWQPHLSSLDVDRCFHTKLVPYQSPWSLR